MALAPKPANLYGGGPDDRIAGSTRDSGHGKQGKRNQRARNADSPDRKLTQNSGSSGGALKVAGYPKVPHEDIADLLVSLCDIAAKVNHTQLGASGYLTMNLGVPLAYADDVVRAHAISQQGLVYIKVFYVDTEAYLAAGGIDLDSPPDLEDVVTNGAI